jgi:prolyl-tRNA synthetase
VKLTDAELLGMPTIVTVSPRSLAAGGVEVTTRASGHREVRPIEELLAKLREGHIR